jgi:hypothetical protein
MPPLSTGRPKTSLLRASQTLKKREVRELATPVHNHIISDRWTEVASDRRGLITSTLRTAAFARRIAGR